VNDTWLEVVGVLGSLPESGGKRVRKLENLNNFIYIPAEHVPVSLSRQQFLKR